MTPYYVGIDLHTRTIQICVLNEQGNRVLEKSLPCSLDLVLEHLAPFGSTLLIAVESTYNWYWLVDGLMDAGYDVRLAHAYGLHLITKAKVKTDKRDAYQLARYLRWNDLPEGFIYPKEKRPYRDLLRRRMSLVQQRSAVYTSLRIQLRQHNLDTFSFEALKRLSPPTIAALHMPDPTKLYAKMTLEHADLLNGQIDTLEKQIKHRVKQEPVFKLLKTTPGIHDILGLMIYYEVGDINRFESDRHFVSYSRLAPPIKSSGDTTSRGRGGKQGNPYLKWAFCQAAIQAARAYPRCKKFKERHARRRSGKIGRLKANNILAHKLATATFFILRDEVPFDPNKMFN